ncbi:hypothetical protein PGIGA_G00221870 [Pangasianodon gigas]|uniref:Uncharacterized protein n=1 Tax=Pangasianodon gigas TaxID=30993 RepID=A0ACC5WJ97_PANGG|nr:hypothetical protein [Pangasianodon gigas]
MSEPWEPCVLLHAGAISLLRAQTHDSAPSVQDHVQRVRISASDLRVVPVCVSPAVSGFLQAPGCVWDVPGHLVQHQPGPQQGVRLRQLTQHHLRHHQYLINTSSIPHQYPVVLCVSGGNVT